MPRRPLARICCVEDDEDVQRIIRLALERIGRLAVEIVADSTHALERITAFRPDLVVLDWMMPGTDGPELLRQLRDQPGTRELPVVFLTARASPRELEELRALGAAGTISKPFSPVELPQQLRAIWDALPEPQT